MSGTVMPAQTILEAPILNGYGLSEVPGIAGERFPRDRLVPGVVGKPWCDVTILDGDRGSAGSGEIGEIVVRGPTLFPGYLDDPEANAAAFLPGGWFRTGDLGFLDDAGYLHLTARMGEIINRGGEKISPTEVDASLLAHPAVKAAATFAVPDERLGEDIVAAVVALDGAAPTPRELRTWMLARLAPHKVPRRIWFVDDLPRTASDKVQRGELAHRWDEGNR